MLQLTNMLLIYGQAMLSRYQNAAAASREYAERFPERHDPGPRQLLIYIVEILKNNV
jgi:hypothetical protein